MKPSSGPSPRSPGSVRPWGLAVVLNNYLHDLATGTWLAANAFQWGVVRRDRSAAAPLEPATAAGLRAVRTVGRASLWWIVLGGLVRALAFRRYEWSDAAGRRQLGLLGVKHVLLFGAVAAGRHLEREAASWQRRAASDPPA